MNIIDHFLSAAGNRRIELCRRPHPHKPWIIRVMIPKARNYGDWRELSTSEYADEDVARRDFELRRPNFRVSLESADQYGRGKRLVQETFKDKLK